jgi:predicted GIY-YIG superfamily endonuclease
LHLLPPLLLLSAFRVFEYSLLVAHCSLHYTTNSGSTAKVSTEIQSISTSMFCWSVFQRVSCLLVVLQICCGFVPLAIECGCGYSSLFANQQNDERSPNVYILELEQGKLYVGRTTDIAKRIEQHFLGEGSAWTKRYKPVAVVATMHTVDMFDEDKWVKICMRSAGIDNVRGGSYSSMRLSVEQKKTLEREIRTAEDRCFKCGSSDHFSSDCPQNHVRQRVTPKPPQACFLCGGEGHTPKNCYAKTHVKRYALGEESLLKAPRSSPTKVVCVRCGRASHTADTCFAGTHSQGYVLARKGVMPLTKRTARSRNPEPVCFRCGREGHTADGCYASKHAEGGILTQRRERQQTRASKTQFRSQSVMKCYRCKRPGHLAPDCYAVRDANGKFIGKR